MNKLFKNIYFQIIISNVIAFWTISAAANNKCPNPFSNPIQENQSRKNSYTKSGTGTLDATNMQKTFEENQAIKKYQEGLAKLNKDILDDTLVKLYEKLMVNDSEPITQRYHKMDYFVEDNKEIFDEMIRQIHKHITQKQTMTSHLVQKYKGKNGPDQFINDYETYFNDIVDTLFDKLFSLEKFKNSPIQQHQGTNSLIKFLEENPFSGIPTPEFVTQKYPEQNSHFQSVKNNKQAFGNGIMQKAFEKNSKKPKQEKRTQQQSSTYHPENYELVKIEDHHWLINRHNKNKKDAINTVQTILAEKNKLNQLFKQRVGSPALEISAIWNQFHGSIDEFLAVRKESNFTKFRTEDKSPWQLMEESVGPQMTKTVVSLLYPVLSLQEISQIWMSQEQLDRQITSTTSFLIKQKPNPPMFPIQQPVYDQITKDFQTIDKKSLDTTLKRRLMKKIIKIVQAMDPYPADRPSQSLN